MKIVRLEQDKIKVVLSDADLENMNIDASSLSPTSPELSLFLCEVMDAVKAQTGFSAEQGQVVVEAAQEPGGIVLLLSKHPNTSDKCKNRSIRTARKNDCAVFEFLSFENLIGMLRNVSPLYLLNMRLYSYNDKFYLSVPRRRIPILIYEYSFKNRKSAVAESILAEYGSLLAGGYKLMCISTGLKKLN